MERRYQKCLPNVPESNNHRPYFTHCASIYRRASTLSKAVATTSTLFQNVTSNMISVSSQSLLTTGLT